MSQLSGTKWVATNKGATLLTDMEIERLLEDLNGWSLVIHAGIRQLSRRFDTGNFNQTMTFVNSVAELAESHDHHPRLIVEYDSVTVIWWSHRLGGLHINDFIMAARTSEMA